MGHPAVPLSIEELIQDDHGELPILLGHACTHADVLGESFAARNLRCARTCTLWRMRLWRGRRRCGWAQEQVLMSTLLTFKPGCACLQH